jgi:hypothetical protein
MEPCLSAMNPSNDIAINELTFFLLIFAIY